MRLVGAFSSPYVRRVAVTLQMMEIPYTHEPLSVFRDFDSFSAVNPAVKAPTLVTDEGVVLVDSTLILEAVAALHPSAPTLMPEEPADRVRALRIIGLALMACEKTVQSVYERRLRPPEKQHEPWLERVAGQRAAAFRMLDDEFAAADPWVYGKAPLQPDVTAAVVWSFARSVLGTEAALAPADHPHLARLTERAEALPSFQAAPDS